MLWVVFWCPEEDVELSIFIFNYKNLFLFKNTKNGPESGPSGMEVDQLDSRNNFKLTCAAALTEWL